VSGFDTEPFTELIREEQFLYDTKYKFNKRDIVQQAWEVIRKAIQELDLSSF
jgi:hypothetical protein